ncbi:two-component system response regulator [Candidatus Omnitrophota bacterium]
MEEKKKILLVDDEEDTLLHLGNILKRNNYEVVTTSQGRDAISLAKQNTPNVIILDVLMPDMDGAEVAATLEQDPSTKDIPIIFLTGIFTKEEEFPGKKTGKRFAIAKPVASEELLATIAQVIPS